mmetsp:Transcript_44937/g.72181  ORF Transcript_44937/g.72181 Transcript_44937/m.72181 type:complete len:217 (+) Transcript_44937:1353-2003(+)
MATAFSAKLSTLHPIVAANGVRVSPTPRNIPCTAREMATAGVAMALILKTEDVGITNSFCKPSPIASPVTPAAKGTAKHVIRRAWIIPATRPTSRAAVDAADNSSSSPSALATCVVVTLTRGVVMTFEARFSIDVAIPVAANASGPIFPTNAVSTNDATGSDARANSAGTAMLKSVASRSAVSREMTEFALATVLFDWPSPPSPSLLFGLAFAVRR